MVEPIQPAAPRDPDGPAAGLERPRPDQSPGLKQAMLDATARVLQIIDAAEQEARGVRREAEREAERYLASRRNETNRLVETRVIDLSARIEPLVTHLERMHAEARQLAAELEALLGEARRPAPERRPRAAAPSAAPEPPAAAEPPAAPSAAPEPLAPKPSAPAGLRTRLFGRSNEGRDPVDDKEEPLVHAFPGTRRERLSGPGAGAEQALLRATQMAVAGSDRAEIERVLRDELGVDDPSPVVQQVLGAR